MPGSEHPGEWGDPQRREGSVTADTLAGTMSLRHSDEDHERVRLLLGREPKGAFDVVLRDGTGGPVVLRNHPLLDDGTPMPTRFWLVGVSERLLVSRLESARGVSRAESEVDPAALERCHRLYALERDAQIPPDHVGPCPHGGVGGTRVGVKCLHAHYANLLSGADDPVGRWVEAHLHEVDDCAVGRDE